MSTRRSPGDRAQADQLRERTAAAVEDALRLAPEVADAANQPASERAVDVAFASMGDAAFALKRVNEALAVGEWLDEVEAWVWRGDRSSRPALTDHGAAQGFELRLQQRSR